MVDPWYWWSLGDLHLCLSLALLLCAVPVCFTGGVHIHMHVGLSAGGGVGPGGVGAGGDSHSRRSFYFFSQLSGYYVLALCLPSCFVSALAGATAIGSGRASSTSASGNGIAGGGEKSKSKDGEDYGEDEELLNADTECVIQWLRGSDQLPE